MGEGSGEVDRVVADVEAPVDVDHLEPTQTPTHGADTLWRLEGVV